MTSLLSIKKTTWLGGYVNLGNTLLGAGILGLPYAFANSGYVLGTFMLIICGTFSATALHSLTISARRTSEKGEQSSFYSVAAAIDPRLTMAVDLAVFIKCFGVSSAYLIVVGDLMPDACEELGGKGASTSRTMWVFFGFIIAAPFCLSHSLDFLKYTSSACIVFIIFLTFIVFLYSIPDDGLDPCEGWNENDADNDECEGHDASLELTSGSFSRVFTIFIFSFTCQQNIFSIYNEIYRQTLETIDSIIVSTIGTASVLYMIVGFCGYETYGSLVDSDILNNYPQNKLMSIVRMCIAFVVAFSYPLQINPGRRCFITLCSSFFEHFIKSSKNESKVRKSKNKQYGGMVSTGSEEGESEREDDEDEEDEENKSILTKLMTRGLSFSLFGTEINLSWEALRYWLATAFILFGTLVLALAVDDLGIVLGVIGATGSTLVGYILPGYFYLKLNVDGWINSDTFSRLQEIERSYKPSDDSDSDVGNANKIENPLHAGGGGDGGDRGGSGCGVGRGIVVGKFTDFPDNSKFWPTDPTFLKYIALAQFGLGMIIMPVALICIIVSA